MYHNRAQRNYARQLRNDATEAEKRLRAPAAWLASRSYRAKTCVFDKKA
jgi:hypothetical protein